MNETRKYPIDFETVHKGDIIKLEELERIFATSYKSKDENNWWSKCLNLCSLIEKRAGIIAVSEMNGKQVRLLTDSEAAMVLEERHERHLNGLELNARRGALIDPDGLTRDEQDRAEKQNLRRVQAVMAIRREDAKQKRLLGLFKREALPSGE